MKSFFFLSSILLMTTLTHAQKAELTVIDPNIDTSSLESNFNVHHGSTHRSSIPDKGERDFLLKEFEKKTINWDQLKKDIFYMDLKSRNIKDLTKKYPEFSSKELSELKGKRE